MKLKIVLLILLFAVKQGVLAQNLTKSESDTTLYQIYSVETPPEFPQGQSVFFKFLGKMKYPSDLKENGIEGSLYFDFIVEIDGSVHFNKILRGSNFFKESVIKLINEMPCWKPAIKNGKYVRCLFPCRISCIKIE